MESITLVRKKKFGSHDERYATLSGLDGLVFLVQWKTDELHQFLRTTGECVESPGGIMRGWSVSSEDLKRLAPSETLGPVSDDTLSRIMNNKALWGATTPVKSKPARKR